MRAHQLPTSPLLRTGARCGRSHPLTPDHVDVFGMIQAGARAIARRIEDKCSSASPMAIGTRSFLEPEGYNTSALPQRHQHESFVEGRAAGMLAIPGLERAEIPQAAMPSSTTTLADVASSRRSRRRGRRPLPRVINGPPTARRPPRDLASRSTPLNKIKEVVARWSISQARRRRRPDRRPRDEGRRAVPHVYIAGRVSPLLCTTTPIAGRMPLVVEFDSKDDVELVTDCRRRRRRSRSCGRCRATKIEADFFERWLVHEVDQRRCVSCIRCWHDGVLHG